MSTMAKEVYEEICILIEENDALKEDAKSKMANQLADLYAREQSLSVRLAKLRVCLYAIAGFKGDERITSGVASYALELDEHEGMAANGSVYPEAERARTEYARMVVDGFVKMVARGG